MAKLIWSHLQPEAIHHLTKNFGVMGIVEVPSIGVALDLGLSVASSGFDTRISDKASRVRHCRRIRPPWIVPGAPPDSAAKSRTL